MRVVVGSAKPAPDLLWRNNKVGVDARSFYVTCLKEMGCMPGLSGGEAISLPAPAQLLVQSRKRVPL